jgi:serine/threonine protein phosphatase PrpC
MKVLDVVTTAGGTRANEDRAGHSGSLAWVIDGATDLYYGNAALPADSDVQWLVDVISQQLHRAGAEGCREDGAALLDTIARHVGEQLAAHGFPADRVPPACSLAVAVDQGDHFQITRIGDATAVVTGATPGVLATDYFDQREAAAVATQQDGCSPDEVVAAMGGRRLHTMTAGDRESVFSGHPRRRLRPHTITGRWDNTEAILLCTDGFARLITDYTLYRRWSDVVADGRGKGLAYLEKLLRDTENDPKGETPGRFKKADDVAALLLVP